MKKKLISSNRVVKHFTFEAKAVNEDEHVVEGIFSTPAVDRHEEVVIQEGWKLDDYLRNPVVLWSHDNYQFPLAQMVALGFENGNLTGKMKFAVEEYDVAATAFRLMKGKYLRAFSVGFINNVYEVDNGKEIVRLTENTLLEVSVVNVPANQEALAKMKTINLMEDLEKKTEPKEPGEKEKVAEAVKTIVGATDSKIKREAIEALTDALKALEEPDTQDNLKGRTPHRKVGGKQKIPVKVFNRAIRAMLKAKKIH